MSLTIVKIVLLMFGCRYTYSCLYGLCHGTLVQHYKSWIMVIGLVGFFTIQLGWINQISWIQ